MDPTSGDLLVAEGEAGVVSEFNGAGNGSGWITNTSPAALGRTEGGCGRGLGERLCRGSGAREGGHLRPRRRGTGRDDGEGIETHPHHGGPDGHAQRAGETRALVLPVGHHAGVRLEHRDHGVCGWGTGGATDAHRTAFEHHVLLPAGRAKTKTARATARSKQFTTPTAVEGLSTGPVTNLQPESATLTGSLGAEWVRRPLLLPVGHDHELREHESRTAGYRRRQRQRSRQSRSRP